MSILGELTIETTGVGDEAQGSLNIRRHIVRVTSHGGHDDNPSFLTLEFFNASDLDVSHLEIVSQQVQDLTSLSMIWGDNTDVLGT